jgi:hypothetical protein
LATFTQCSFYEKIVIKSSPVFHASWLNSKQFCSQPIFIRKEFETMKHLGPLLAGGLTMAVVLVVGIFSFLPAGSPSPLTSADSVPDGQIVVAPVDTSQLEAAMAEREAVYVAQIDELNRALQERQAVYQTQLQDFSSQITTTQDQLGQLQAQERILPAHITQLENTRAERQATYQAQLAQLQNQYNERIAQLQAQLSEAQLRLAEANAQLGR